jgi:transposase
VTRDREPEYVRRLVRLLDCDPPWYFHKITKTFDPDSIHVWLLHALDAMWRCPECPDLELPCHSHAPERMFLCVDCPGLTIYVRVKVPRVWCPVHGLRDADVPWPRDRARWRPVNAGSMRGGGSGEPSDS